MTDPFIGFLFTDSVDIDMREHLPIISDFWETILFQKPAYKRGPQVMNVHLALNEKVKLKDFHFRRWLYLFNKTVDELFDGPTGTPIASSVNCGRCAGARCRHGRRPSTKFIRRSWVPGQCRGRSTGWAPTVPS